MFFGEKMGILKPNRFLLKHGASYENLKKITSHQNLKSQMEIEIALSHDAQTQPKSTSIHGKHFACGTSSY